MPVIAFGQRKVYTGCPTLEQAEELIRCEEIASRVSKYAIDKSAVVRLFAEGEVAVDPAALAHYYPISLDFPIFWLGRLDMSATRMPACCWWATSMRSTVISMPARPILSYFATISAPST